MEQLAGGGEDDERDLGVAEDGELLRLLEQAPPSLGERHLPRRRVVDLPYLNPLPRHDRSIHSFPITNPSLLRVSFPRGKSGSGSRDMREEICGTRMIYLGLVRCSTRLL